MSHPLPIRHLRRFGSVQVYPLEDDNQGSPPQSNHRYVWRPDPEIWSEVLRAGAFPLQLEMRCSLGANGCRFFTPIEPPVDTVARAAIIGAAIRDASGRTRAVQDAYNASAIQMWQVAPNLSELFARRFKRTSDLQLSQGSSASHRDVLPEQLGVVPVPGGNSRRWTIAALLKQGRKAAERDGRPVSDESCIQYGLYEAAKLHPIPASKLTKSKVRRMLRLGLFDLGPSNDVDKATRRRVRDRFIKAVQQHRNDSDVVFRRWLTSFDNLVHQISKKKKPDGPIDRAIVRRAIVEDSFASHFEVAECMDVGMRAFAASLAKPLNRNEKATFALLYQSQPWLGGLTLLMLNAHFALLSPAITELLKNPRSTESRGTLIRMLLFYGEMASHRRAADRDAKKRGLARNTAGRPAKHSGRGIEALAGRPELSLAKEIVRYLCEVRGIDCECHAGGRWFLVNADRFSSDRRVDVECERCQAKAVIMLTAADIEMLHREFED
jgi:hypothetical protein